MQKFLEEQIHAPKTPLNVHYTKAFSLELKIFKEMTDTGW